MIAASRPTDGRPQPYAFITVLSQINVRLACSSSVSIDTDGERVTEIFSR